MQVFRISKPTAVLFAAILGLGTIAVQAQARQGQNCPPRCGIGIEVPENPSQSPRVDVETLSARPGQEVSWESNHPVLVVFPEETPFVGPNGRPVYQFNVRASHRLRIRDDSDQLCSPPGCKYMVIDLGNDQRPPLDPYIIIDR